MYHAGAHLGIASDGEEAEASKAWAQGSTPADTALKKEIKKAAEQLAVSDPSDFTTHAAVPKRGMAGILSPEQEAAFQAMEGTNSPHSGVVKTSTRSSAHRAAGVKEVRTSLGTLIPPLFHGCAFAGETSSAGAGEGTPRRDTIQW